MCIIIYVQFSILFLHVIVCVKSSRTHVFYDAHMLDSFFDAGGDMTAGLIACSVVAKWLWTSSLTWSTANTQEVGTDII